MMLFLSFIQWWSDMAAKCDRNMIADDCEDYNDEQCWAGGRLDCWSGDRGSWWVIKCEEMNVVAVSKLLIVRHITEKRGMFHIHSLIVNSDVEFIHEICLNYKFGELESHQWPDFIEEALNENCFEGFIIKVVMLDNNAQKFSIVFLKMMILLLADL